MKEYGVPFKSDDVFVRPLGPGDVDKIVELHIEVFPDYFLTHLGSRFLRLFYYQFVNNKNNIAVLAEVDGRPVGFVSGVVKSSDFYQDFYRRHFFMIAITVFARMFLSSVVCAGVFERAGQIVPALIARFGGSRLGKSNDIRVYNNSLEIKARLLSIGVSPDVRGAGIAEKMVNCFCRLAGYSGAKTVGLTVFSYNSRAINFYNKNGWHKESENEIEIAYSRKVCD